MRLITSIDSSRSDIKNPEEVPVNRGLVLLTFVEARAGPILPQDETSLGRRNLPLELLRW